MGTRGTLRVYVNGELKVRQYNQWDSYPTGQFQEICEFMRSPTGLIKLAQNLGNMKFAPSEDIEKLKKGESLGEDKEAEERWLKILIDRDFGSDMLWFIAGMPHACKWLPDWVDVFSDCIFGETHCDEDLREEGNYRIDIECEYENRSYINYVKPDTVRAKLSGAFHDTEREFDWGYIPTDEECKAWEDEDRGKYE